MKLGGFGKIADYLKIREAGFDYAELDMPEIEELSEADFEALCEKVKEGGFPVLSGARILPIAEPTFFVGGFDPESLREYLFLSCKRCAALGMTKVIMGNGKARWNFAEDPHENDDLFAQIIGLAADAAGEYGMEFILEPLGPKYSNYINTLPEAVEMIKKTGRKNIYIMADMRHMVWNEESFEDLVECVEYVHHVHIDYPTSFPERPFPDAADDYDYAPFLDALARSGYQGTLTIESDIPEDWNAAYRQSMTVLSGLERN